MSCCAISGKTKERLSAASLVYCRIKRRYMSLRILPQREARSVKQVYPYKVRESHKIYSRIIERYLSRTHLKAVNKDCRKSLPLQGQKQQHKLQET